MWAMFAYLAHRENAKNAPEAGVLDRYKQTIPPEPRLSGVVLDKNGKISDKPVYPRVELKQLRLLLQEGT